MIRFILPLVFVFSLNTLATDFVVDKNGKCKVYRSSKEVKLNLYWHGPCLNGFADGVGVARYLKGAKVVSVFYGLMKAGYWSQGVHAVDGGYVAGRFEKNQPVKSLDASGVDDRHIIIKAFELASQAALQISKDYEKAGNKASAKHYKSESESLSQQID